MAVNNDLIRARNRTARWLTEVFQPPVVVSLQLLISPLAQPGFPETIGYGAMAALFVCVLPLMVLLVLVSALFFNQVRDYQQCARHALTSQASNDCRVQLENSMPGQFQPGR